MDLNSAKAVLRREHLRQSSQNFTLRGFADRAEPLDETSFVDRPDLVQDNLP